MTVAAVNVMKAQIAPILRKLFPVAHEHI